MHVQPIFGSDYRAGGPGAEDQGWSFHWINNCLEILFSIVRVSIFSILIQLLSVHFDDVNNLSHSPGFICHNNEFIMPIGGEVGSPNSFGIGNKGDDGSGKQIIRWESRLVSLQMNKVQSSKSEFSLNQWNREGSSSLRVLRVESLWVLFW